MKIVPTIPKPRSTALPPPVTKGVVEEGREWFATTLARGLRMETGRTKCTCDRFPYRASARMVDCTIALRSAVRSYRPDKRHGHFRVTHQPNRDRGNDDC